MHANNNWSEFHNDDELDVEVPRASSKTTGPPPKVLIVDSDDEQLFRIRHYLELAYSGARTTTYNTAKKGHPSSSFDWAQFDVVLIDCQLGNQESNSGLELLRRCESQTAMPPVIMLADNGNERLAVKAIKFGAADYVNKTDLSPDYVKNVIDVVLEEATKKSKKVTRSSEVTATFGLDKLTQVSSSGTLPDGNDIGYKFVRLICRGPMSTVYLAERLSDGLTIVVKVVNLDQAQSDDVKRRFVQEAELIQGVDSPFVVRVFEQGFTEECGFIAMEFFSRGDMKQRLVGPFSPRDAVLYLANIAYGLDAIHNVGIIHRDLKPDNIMFRNDESMALADFGISKRLGGTGDMTTLGKILGTPHYMSPEQGQGLDVDTRSDLYSAGVLFYEMLTGEKPYSATSAVALIRQHVDAPLPQLSGELQKYQFIVEKLLSKDPGDRYQTAAELAKVLQDVWMTQK